MALHLKDLANLRQWCAWREETPAGRKPTKVPYGAAGERLRSNDRNSWLTLGEAQDLSGRLGAGAGVGVMLGAVDPAAGDGWADWSVVGIDYDTCMGGPDGMEGWAAEGIGLLDSYAEVSPSGTGAKQFLLLHANEADGVRTALRVGAGKTGRKFSPGRKGESHPPSIEAYLERRFFAVTWDALDDGIGLGVLTVDRAAALIVGPVVRLLGRAPNTTDDDAGESLVGEKTLTRPGIGHNREKENEGEDAVARMRGLGALRPRLGALLDRRWDDAGLQDHSRSGIAFAMAGELRAAGWPIDDAADALRGWDETAGWMAEKGDPGGGRELSRAWSRFPEVSGEALGRTGGLEKVPGLSSDDPPPWAVRESARKGGRGTGRGTEGDERAGDGGTYAESPPTWTAMLQETKAKEWRPNLHNARLALLHAPEWKGLLAYNDFSDRILLRRKPPYERNDEWKGERLLRDSDTINLSAWLQGMGIQASSATAMEAMVSASLEQRFNPVTEYLEARSAEWDGERRLDTWLRDHLGAEDSDYVRAVSAMTLIGAVARAMVPGCKMDTVGLLEGRQGIGKSSALRTLFGSDHFIDRMTDIMTKDAALQLAGRWCVEHAEMDKLKRAEASHVKSFISTQVDCYRKPYGRVTEDIPRRCVFWGTLNADGNAAYLTDETGNRRFWPVRCGTERVDLVRLEEARDQIWSEATVRWKAGEKWWMAGSAERDQQQQVAQRLEDDAWASRIGDFLGDRSTTSVAELLHQAIGKPPERWTQADQTRVARILIGDGWTRRQIRVQGSERREWHYVKEKTIVVQFPSARNNGQ